jgi:glycosyltransferase involved in cell wall biosynthesis
MIRALLDNGVKLKLLVLNQSEEKTSSASLKKRLQEHYKNANLSVEVRRHPNYSKPVTLKQKIEKKIYHTRLKLGQLIYKDALINNTVALPVNFENLICKSLTSRNYDIAWFNYMKVMPSNLPKTTTRIVVDMHDMQSTRVKSDVLPTIERSRRKKYLDSFIKSEKAGLDNCSIAISISPVETQAIKEFYTPKAELVTLKASDDPKLLDTAAFLYDIAFIGSNSAPNVDGLVWFIQDVFPIISQDHPAVRFLVQGNINRNKLVKSAIESSKHNKKIIQQGFVDSLDDVYKTAKVIICPIRYGTGMKIKVVEGMAYGKALVGTPVAFEGIDVSMGLACETQDHDFAATTLAFITNDNARKNAENASRITFANSHSYLSLKRDILEKIIS